MLISYWGYRLGHQVWRRPLTFILYSRLKSALRPKKSDAVGIQTVGILPCRHSGRLPAEIPQVYVRGQTDNLYVQCSQNQSAAPMSLADPEQTAHGVCCHLYFCFNKI